jgi:hypothetical protein
MIILKCPENRGPGGISAKIILERSRREHNKLFGMNTYKGFHQRGHRGHGEKTQMKLWLNKQGAVIPVRADDGLFSVLSVRSVVNLFFAGQFLS